MNLHLLLLFSHQSAREVREMAAVREEFRNTLNEKQSLAVVNTVV